jgi:hypothetical protein
VKQVSSIENKVDRFCELKRQITLLDAEAKQIEAELLIHSEELLADTKYKSVRLRGGDIACAVTATTAETVSITYPSLLKEIFGKVYDDCVKEETKYTINAHGKRILISLLTGAYSEGTSLTTLIGGLNVPENVRNSLMKKLKGVNFDTDKRTFAKFCSLDDDSASDYAYMASEAAAWQNIFNLLVLNNETYRAFDLAVLKDKVLRAAAVDQTVKVSIFDSEA